MFDKEQTRRDDVGPFNRVEIMGRLNAVERGELTSLERRLLAELRQAARERDFWKDRYDAQHRKVHALEDRLAAVEREQK